MEPLRTIVIDDEPLAQALLDSYVKKIPFLQLIASFSSAVAALQSKELKEADLVFLDIQMPELNGMELAQIIEKRTKIVFTTAFSEYALDGFEVNALDYLLKPINFNNFLKAAKRAKEWFENQENNPKIEQDNEKFIYVKTDYKIMRIDLNKLLYIEGLKDYVKLHLEDEPRPILTLMTIKSIIEKLPESQFMRVHRSFIVQKKKIKIIERGRILFGKSVIPVSDTYKEELEKYLNIK